MLMQVLSMTPDQISALPPTEREAIQVLVSLLILTEHHRVGFSNLHFSHPFCSVISSWVVSPRNGETFGHKVLSTLVYLSLYFCCIYLWILLTSTSPLRRPRACM